MARLDMQLIAIHDATIPNNHAWIVSLCASPNTPLRRCNARPCFACHAISKCMLIHVYITNAHANLRAKVSGPFGISYVNLVPGDIWFQAPWDTECLFGPREPIEVPVRLERSHENHKRSNTSSTPRHSSNSPYPKHRRPHQLTPDARATQRQKNTWAGNGFETIGADSQVETNMKHHQIQQLTSSAYLRQHRLVLHPFMFIAISR